MIPAHAEAVTAVQALVVDDDPDFRDSLAARLRKQDIAVDVVASAQEAVVMLSQKDYDCLIADIHRTPGTGGAAVFSEIRARYGNLPLILITAYADLDAAGQTVGLNAAECIVKPLRGIEQLLEPLYKAVYCYRLRRENERLQRAVAEKNAEVSEARRLCENLVQMSGDMIFTIDRQGIFVRLNRRGEQLLGYTPETMRELSLESVARTLNGLSVRSLFQQPDDFFKRYSDTAIPLIFVCRCGMERIVDVRLAPVFDAEGRIKFFQCIARDCTEQKKLEQELLLAEKKIVEQHKDLERKNIALREILGHIEDEKKRIQENVAVNVDQLMLPALEKLRLRLDKNEVRYLDIIQENLRNLVSTFGRSVTQERLRLSPRELEICDMIRKGLSSKEIAEMLNVSQKTVDRHRNNIREKLGLVRQDTNLTAYLKQMAR
ncbi:MAG: response regulator [Candidatus Omnitrophica bacterium]|nr:response regulator [Candidatus Omnitrophota bacterium]